MSKKYLCKVTWMYTASPVTVFQNSITFIRVNGRKYLNIGNGLHNSTHIWNKMLFWYRHIALTRFVPINKLANMELDSYWLVGPSWGIALLFIITFYQVKYFVAFFKTVQTENKDLSNFSWQQHTVSIFSVITFNSFAFRGRRKEYWKCQIRK